jgi:serine phosphatase RsbU (regulator of sigma subunit)
MRAFRPKITKSPERQQAEDEYIYGEPDPFLAKLHENSDITRWQREQAEQENRYKVARLRADRLKAQEAQESAMRALEAQKQKLQLEVDAKRLHVERLRGNAQIQIARHNPKMIDALVSHVLSPEPLMEASQVAAAKALLAKIIPDVTAVKVGGDADNPVKSEINVSTNNVLVIRNELMERLDSVRDRISAPLLDHDRAG